MTSMNRRQIKLDMDDERLIDAVKKLVNLYNCAPFRIEIALKIQREGRRQSTSGESLCVASVSPFIRGGERSHKYAAHASLSPLFSILFCFHRSSSKNSPR